MKRFGHLCDHLNLLPYNNALGMKIIEKVSSLSLGTYLLHETILCCLGCCQKEKRLASLLSLGLFQVGSVNPVENFRAVVRQKNASFEEGECLAISLAFKRSYIIQLMDLRSK